MTKLKVVYKIKQLKNDKIVDLEVGFSYTYKPFHSITFDSPEHAAKYVETESLGEHFDYESLVIIPVIVKDYQ